MCNNRTEADINEIYFTYLLNNKQFPDQTTEEHYQTKRKLLSNSEILEAETKAELMHDYFVKNYDTSNIRQIFWTGQNISLEKIIGIKIDDKETPADVVILRNDNTTFGISLKTVKKGRAVCLGDYAFQGLQPYVNVTEGCELIDYALNEGVVELIPELAEYTLKQRDYIMKRDKNVYNIISDYGDVVLEELRDELFNNLTNVYKEEDIRDLIINYLLIKSGYDKLPYIQLECCGTIEKNNHQVFDDNIQDRLNHAHEGKYEFSLCGKKCISVKANGKRLIKLSLKFKSRKLTGKPVVKVDKWT